jgi:tripartite-type tricarboxylate transporter receptor subunit TctC
VRRNSTHQQVPWVPSKGAAADLQELVAGGVSVVTSSVVEASGLMAAGKVKTLAVMASDRLAKFPDVPTLSEADGPNWEISAWRGIAAPVGIPEEAQARLENAMKTVWKSAEFQNFMKGCGFGLSYLPREDFGAWLAKSDEDLVQVMSAVGLAK